MLDNCLFLYNCIFVMEVWTLGFVPTKESCVFFCCQQNKLNDINYNLKSIGILKWGISKGKRLSKTKDRVGVLCFSQPCCWMVCP